MGDLETITLQLVVASRMAGGVLKFDAVQRKFKFSVVQGHV